MFKIIHGRIGTDIWANSRLKTLKNLIDKGKFLDLGCGPGYVGREVEDRCEVYYLDANPDELKNIKSKRKYVGYAEKTPFKKDFFDWVMCGDMLEHLDDDGAAVKEIHRILKKNGKVIVTVPAYRRLYGHHDKLIGHKRRYDKEDLKNLLEKKGFKIEKIFFTCGLLFFPLLLNQFVTKKSSAYQGKSKIEHKLLPVLDFISTIESKLRLPWGIGLLAVARK